MSNNQKKKILLIDDDVEILNLLSEYLVSLDCEIFRASSGREGLLKAQNILPDLIILDIMMPEMDGFEVCQKIQQNKNLSYCPVVFLSAHDEKENRTKAFSLGCVDFLPKPISKKELLRRVSMHLDISQKWQKIKKKESLKEKLTKEEWQKQHPSEGGRSKGRPEKFYRFLAKELKLDPDDEQRLAQFSFLKIYQELKKLRIDNVKTAHILSKFSGLEYISTIEPDSVALGLLPYSFCKTNLVIPVKENGSSAFIISNPLDLTLLDTLHKVQGSEKPLNLKLSDPESIHHFFESVQNFDTSYSPQKGVMDTGKSKILFQREKKNFDAFKREISLAPGQDTLFPDDKKLSAIVNLTNQILISAIKQRASDIHIEPKESKAHIRFRIDGDMRDAYLIKPEICRGLISRLKVLAHMNIAETRRPQDGSMEIDLDKKKIKVRLATVGTPYGESIIIRIFDPTVSIISLSKLGMNNRQIELMKEMVSSNRGLILVVGPTGSGKTTTLYSLLNSIDTKVRSLISIEDPVEYSIPYANQQEINDKIGVTFESLLKSAVRQDPDILFIGEMRDKYTAKMAVEAASTGHLTLSTLHTLNATTAIFRLERFDISRSALAEAVLGIVAQRLIKTLCPFCKAIRAITKEEAGLLANFTQDVPQFVGYPVGCPKCNNSGYLGRCGIYEILSFDSDIADKVRKGVSISDIRSFLLEKNVKLLFHHALEKIRQKTVSIEEAYSKILSEEDASQVVLRKEIPRYKQEKKAISLHLSQKGTRILVVDDDQDMRNLICRLLTKQNYEVFSAQDGIDALMQIGKTSFDLILSDISMPNLGGMKLLEILTQRGINTPVIFVSSRTEEEDEIRGLSLGAVDYIKKPISKEILFFRIEKVLRDQKSLRNLSLQEREGVNK